MARKRQLRNEQPKAMSKSKTLQNVLEKAFLTHVENISPALVSELKDAFSPHSLSTAFRNKSSVTKKNAAIDKDTMGKTFCTLSGRSDLCEKIAEILLELYDDLGSRLCDEREGLHVLRTVLILISCPVLSHPNKMWSRRVVHNVCKGLMKLYKDNTKRFNVLVSWLKVDENMFRRALHVFKSHLSTRLDEDVNVLLLLHPLSLLNMVNEAGRIVPIRDFYITDMPDTYTQWHILHIRNFLDNNLEASNSNGKRFTWLDFPFLLNTVSKWIFLQLEMFRQTLTVKNIPINPHAWMNGYTNVKPSGNPKLEGPSEPVGLTQQLRGLGLVEKQVQRGPGTVDIQAQHREQHIPQQYISFDVRKEPLVFEVDRSHIVKSAMDNVRKYRQEEGTNDAVWLRPLQVNFKGEYAMDLGGPSKEFFYLLFKELTDTDKHNFFKRVKNGSICFNEAVMPKQHDEIAAIGTLFSLMIYNRAIVTVNFPAKVYGELLSRKYRPRSPVDALEVFRHGFDRCFKYLHIHRLFRPDEFRTLILGGKLDWKSFEEHTLYKSPYSKDHKVMKMFWKVFNSLQEEDRKAFYRFQTCAEYVPINGFKSLGYTIRRLDTQRVYRAEPALILPCVYTCPGILSMDLPEYRTEEDLKERLLLAITAEGYHREARPQAEKPVENQLTGTVDSSTSTGTS